MDGIGRYLEKNTSVDVVGTAVSRYVAPRVTPEPVVQEDATTRFLRVLRRTSPSDDLRVPEVMREPTTLARIASEFPGPRWFDRRFVYRRLPLGRDVGAFARALVQLGEDAVPVVGELLTDPDPDRRFYACLVAGDLAHDSLLAPLLERLDDEDTDVTEAALSALVRWPRPSQLRLWLLTSLDPCAPGITRRRALEALSQLRDPGALRGMIAQLEDFELAEQAHRALRLLTAHDAGATREAWDEWASRHGDRSRVHWLADALVGDDPLLRASAFSELQQTYGELPFDCATEEDAFAGFRARVLSQLAA